jgi:hypothetical protein
MHECAKHRLENAMFRQESAIPTNGEQAQTLMYQRFADDRHSDSESDGGNQMRLCPSNLLYEIADSYIHAPTDCPTNPVAPVACMQIIGCPLVAGRVGSTDRFISIDGYRSAGGLRSIEPCATEPRDAAPEPLSKKFGRDMGRVCRVSEARGLGIRWGVGISSGAPISKVFATFRTSFPFSHQSPSPSLSGQKTSKHFADFSLSKPLFPPFPQSSLSGQHFRSKPCR